MFLMKPSFSSFTVATGILLATTNAGWASSPRQHHFRSMVDVIECGSRSITLRSTDGNLPLTLVWNDSTWFPQKVGIAKRAPASGQTVHGWYRRELGRNVLRQLTVDGVSFGCSLD